jgi:hypothetical protein
MLRFAPDSCGELESKLDGSELDESGLDEAVGCTICSVLFSDGCLVTAV